MKARGSRLARVLGVLAFGAVVCGCSRTFADQIRGHRGCIGEAQIAPHKVDACLRNTDGRRQNMNICLVDDMVPDRNIRLLNDCVNAAESSERLVHHSRKALRAGERAREDSKDHRAFLFLLEPRKRADTRLRKCTCTKECYPTAANAVYAVSWVAERCCFIEIIGDTFSQMLIGYVKWPALFRRANA
jgi:hypothetical protein